MLNIWNRLTFVLPAIVLVGGMLVVFEQRSQAIAATKVPTSRVVVPEDAPLESDIRDDGNSAVPLDEIAPDDSTSSTPDTESSVSRPIPDILDDVSKLPEPVRKMRQNLIDAATTGDIEKLRALLSNGDGKTVLSFGDPTGDPIRNLRQESGDEEGQEILAILLETLEARFVHLDKGTGEEIYVWPYFYAYPLDKLTPQMRVELFRILTAGDLEDSASFGSYIFYRTGIKPDGTWSFFVAGD